MTRKASTMTFDEAQALISGRPAPVETAIDFPAHPMVWIKTLEAGLIESVKFTMVDGELRAEIGFIPPLAEVRITFDLPVSETEGKNS